MLNFETVLYSIGGLIVCFGGVLKGDLTVTAIGVIIIGIGSISRKLDELKR